jgi:hypothetical protein
VTGLPVRLASELEPCPEARRWLIEQLWGERAVGLGVGEPKVGKSWLVLDAALSVASGAPCLRRFEVPNPGPVLLYAAEDGLHVVRQRLDAIAAAAGVKLAGLPLHVITAPRVRLDLVEDRGRLRETVSELQPRLLVLDPLVCLHQIDENQVEQVAPLLAYLRELERELSVAVMLVHHARKGGAERAGQAMRGSSHLHAWGDSNLYLRKSGESLSLTVEHRAAPSMPRLAVGLRERGGGLSLAVLDDGDLPREERGAASPRERVLALLSAEPLTVRELRERCRMRTTTLCEVLAQLVAEGVASKTTAGYCRAA